MMASEGYDPKQATLEIEFRTGDVYEYFEVPREVFQALLDAASKGRLFHAEIDAVYRFVQVTRARTPRH
jgi:hypothetical protein